MLSVLTRCTARNYTRTLLRNTPTAASVAVRTATAARPSLGLSLSPPSSPSLLLRRHSHTPRPPQKPMNNPYALLTLAPHSDDVLDHSVDRYSGITVPDTSLTSLDAESFERLLDSSMRSWTELKRRGIWLQVPIEKADFIAPAAKHGFEFHHAQPRYVMMTLWLPGRPHPCGHSHKTAAEEAASSSSAEVEPSMIPAYASHSLGIGCIVLNSRGELLVIQEKFAHPMLPDFWKLPGGAVDCGEELTEAAEREVCEETGVQSRFRALLGFRHLLNFRFGTGDLYFIAVCSVDESAGIPVPRPQPDEISACKWWDLQEFFQFHSSRWMQELLRESVLQEWAKMFPGRSLPPPPSAERIRQLQTYPAHPEAAAGKFYPVVVPALPPPAGASVGMMASRAKSVLGKIESNFYVVSPPTASNAAAAAAPAAASAAAAATSASSPSNGSCKL